VNHQKKPTFFHDKNTLLGWSVAQVVDHLSSIRRPWLNPEHVGVVGGIQQTGSRRKLPQPDRIHVTLQLTLHLMVEDSMLSI
jgi:hypothetical protein